MLARGISSRIQFVMMWLLYT